MHIAGLGRCTNSVGDDIQAPSPPHVKRVLVLFGLIGDYVSPRNGKSSFYDCAKHSANIKQTMRDCTGGDSELTLCVAQAKHEGMLRQCYDNCRVVSFDGSRNDKIVRALQYLQNIGVTGLARVMVTRYDITFRKTLTPNWGRVNLLSVLENDTVVDDNWYCFAMTWSTALIAALKKCPPISGHKLHVFLPIINYVYNERGKNVQSLTSISLGRMIRPT